MEHDMDVIQIPLSNRPGECALIDAEDYPLVAGRTWRMDREGYIVASTSTKTLYMHREVMRAEPWERVDHKDHVPSDNRKAELRRATVRQNTWNSHSHKDAVSKRKGVWFDKNHGKWSAEIMAHGVRHWLGRHATEEGAAEAYRVASLELHGEFSCTKERKEEK